MTPQGKARTVGVLPRVVNISTQKINFAGLSEVRCGSYRRSLLLPRRTAAGFCLNYYIIAPSIIGQITFIYAKKEHAVTLRYEFAARSDQNKIVVIVPNNGD